MLYHLLTESDYKEYQSAETYEPASLQCGALFGLLMSIFYAIRRKQLNLTDWESLGE